MTEYSFRLTPGYCLYNGIAVLNQDGAKINLLIEDLSNFELKSRIERAFRNHVEYVGKQIDCPLEYKAEISINYEKCNRTELKKAVSNLYREKSYSLGYVAEKSDSYKSDRKEIVKAEDAAAIILLDSILNDARSKGVSDIHIDENEIKYRVKGKLEKQMDLPGQRCLEIVQRIKLLGGMNVIENRKSQDGRFVFNAENPLFVRVSSVPVVGKSDSVCCESIVLRLLDPSKVPLNIYELGFNEKQIERMNFLLSSKDGLVIVCGPTGSGKSTTAASLLKQINDSTNGQKKIISIEDPPEFVIPGVTQLKVDDSRTLSFENLLNHIFRQDPDVIMIGEIRDEKSALAALRASLTGHLVIATLHTSSASGTLLRLENLGLERRMLASVLRGVIVQELELIGEDLVLMADVCFPKAGFSDFCTEDKNQSAIEELFDDESNGGDVLAKSLEVMKSKQLFDSELFSKKRKRRISFSTDSVTAIDLSHGA